MMESRMERLWMPTLARLSGMFLPLLALALSLACGSALAQTTITSVLVNGSPSTTVAPGATVTVTVTATVGISWGATQISTNPASTTKCDTSFYRGAGTHTLSYTYTAPLGSNVYALRVTSYRNSNCSAQPSPTFNLPNAINTGVATLNHVRLLHDGVGLTCTPEVVTLRACANASCSTLFNNSVTVSLATTSGSWSPGTVTFATGSTTASLIKTTAGAATMSGTVTSPAITPTAVQCYQNGVAGSCSITFGTTACSLDAVETGAAPGTDINLRRAGNPITLDVLTLLNGGLNTSSTSTVTATLVDSSTGPCAGAALSAPVTQTFSSANAGRRPYTFTPNAASRNARVLLTTPAPLTQCSTDNFVIRPVAIAVASPDAGADPDFGQSLATSPKLKAGSANFTLQATTATGYNGVPEINTSRLAVSDVGVGEPGVVGTLSGTFAAGAGAGGVATGTTFRYSEAGYFKLLPYAVYDEDYAAIDAAKGDCFTSSALGSDDPVDDPNVAVGGRFGCYFGSAETKYLGRFIPDHFAMTLPTLVNRSALTSCVAPAFSYMGEAMQLGFTLTAQNGANGTTFNYTNRFARINPATQSYVAAVNEASARTPFPACTATPAHPCIATGAATIPVADGEAVVSLPATVLRGTTPAGAFSNFKIGIAPIDDDGVTLATTAFDIDTVNVTAGAANHQSLGSTAMRYGRLAINNAYGSELLKLPVPVTAQYWNGSSWVTNLDDSCTPMGTASFSLSNYAGGITATNLPASSFSGGTLMTGGKGSLLLAKPSPAPAAKGSVQINSVIPHLPGIGRATFGVYKSGPVIYVRETY